MPALTPAQSGKHVKRRLLLDASYRVFTESGYHRTRLEDVAAQAGFSKGSVYNYFEDKEELFLRTSIAATGETVSQLEAELKPDRAAFENIEWMLRHLLSDSGQLFSFVQAITEYHGEVRISANPKTPRELLRAEHLAGLRNILETLANAVRQGKKHGEFATGVDELSTARFLTGLVRSVLLRWRLDGVKSPIDEELGEIMAFASQGLGCRPTTTKQKASRTKRKTRSD
ncbi:MAG: TetR/AcrR family transcriptional regulator [Planctomycetota bacterium]